MGVKTKTPHAEAHLGVSKRGPTEGGRNPLRTFAQKRTRDQIECTRSRRHPAKCTRYKTLLETRPTSATGRVDHGKVAMFCWPEIICETSGMKIEKRLWNLESMEGLCGPITALRFVILNCRIARTVVPSP